MRVVIAGLLAGTIGFAATVQAQTALERGKYLVEGIVGCGNCHTPQGPNGPIFSRALSGGPPLEEPNVFTALPSNITPDPETGIGKWTDAQLKLAIREGKRPDGLLIGPPMPFYYYRHISDADLDAIVAYLRSVPAISNKVGEVDLQDSAAAGLWPADRQAGHGTGEGRQARLWRLPGRTARPLPRVPHADGPDRHSL